MYTRSLTEILKRVTLASFTESPSFKYDHSLTLRAGERLAFIPKIWQYALLIGMCGSHSSIHNTSISIRKWKKVPFLVIMLMGVANGGPGVPVIPPFLSPF